MDADESLIYHQYLDAYKLYKCNINIISWLGIWYINNSLYENAINIFRNANLIQPQQIKRRLMIASCYRRMRNFEKSIGIYLSILDQSADVSMDITVKCLQYLCTIMKQIGHLQLDKYQAQLNEALAIQQQEQLQQTNEQNITQQQQQQTQQYSQQQQKQDQEAEHQ